jgi:transposase
MGKAETRKENQKMKTRATKFPHQRLLLGLTAKAIEAGMSLEEFVQGVEKVWDEAQQYNAQAGAWREEYRRLRAQEEELYEKALKSNPALKKALEQNRQKFSFSEGIKMNRHTYQLFVNGRLIHRSRSGKDAFKNFDSYTPGDWFNYPAGERVRQVQLIRDDGMIQDKGQEAT